MYMYIYMMCIYILHSNLLLKIPYYIICSSSVRCASNMSTLKQYEAPCCSSPARCSWAHRLQPLKKRTKATKKNDAFYGDTNGNIIAYIYNYVYI